MKREILRYSTDSKFIYSDLGFVTLILESVTLIPGSGHSMATETESWDSETKFRNGGNDGVQGIQVPGCFTWVGLKCVLELFNTGKNLGSTLCREKHFEHFFLGNPLRGFHKYIRGVFLQHMGAASHPGGTKGKEVSPTFCGKVWDKKGRLRQTVTTGGTPHV